MATESSSSSAGLVSHSSVNEVISPELQAMITFIKKNIRIKGFTNEKWTDEHDAIVIQFLTLSESRKLIAYMSNEHELVLLIPYAGLPMTPKSFVYFVKRGDRNTSPVITMDNIRTTLQWGFINGGGVDSLLRTMDNVYIPMMKESNNWPEAVRRDITGAAARFMASLVETAHQIRGKTVLYVPPDPIPSDIRVAMTDKDLVQRLEATVIHWTRQIKEVVSNQDASGASAEGGSPLDEINYYVLRCQDLSGITEQLNSTTLKNILAVLREANSSYLGPFETLATSIQRGSDEAADNLRLLSILKPSCENLASSSPVEIPTILPEILNRIRVIGAISKYYCTEERLTALLRKVSNEVIARCVNSIDITAAFDGDVAAVLETLDICVKCCNAWRNAYDETVIAVENNPGVRGRLWTFDTSSIFAQVEAFVQRCRDLTEICEGQQQFMRKTIAGSGDQAPLPCFGGSRGQDITRSLITIEETFVRYINPLRDLQNDILDVKSARWGEANTRFKGHMKDLETMMANVINDAFIGVTSIPVCLELLEAFSSLARRPAVHRAVDKKAAEVFTMFGDQVATIKTEFDSNSVNPPLSPDLPQYAGAAIWARSLQLRAEADWKLLVKAHYLSPSKAKVEAGEAYERLTSGMDEYMRNKYSEWMRTLGDVDQTKVTERLASPLFARTHSQDPEAQHSAVVKSTVPGSPTKATSSAPANPGAGEPKFLASNFDGKVLAMLTEVQTWERFEGKFSIPFYASDLAHSHADSLRVLRQLVVNICDEYNTIIASLDDVEARLFSDAIRRLDRKVAPGLAKITWSTKGVKDFFLKDIRKSCQEVWTVVKAFQHDRATIHRLVESMRDTSLVDIEKNYVHDDGVFQDKQLKHRGHCKNTLVAYHKQMVEILARVYSLFRTDSIPVQKAWNKWIRSLDKRVESALRGTVKSSLGELQKAICGDPLNKEAEVTPVFKLSIVLDGNLVEYRPSIQDLTESINEVSTDLISIIRVVPRLELVLATEIKQYNATEEAIKQAIAKLASSGMGAAAAMRALEKDEAAYNESKEKEAKEMEDTKLIGGPIFFDIISSDITILQAKADIMSVVSASSASLVKHSEDFKKYSHLWDNDKTAFMKRYARTNRPLATVEADVNRFISTENEIRNDIDAAENLAFIRVDHSLLKEALIDHCQQWQRHFTRFLNDNARRELDELIAKIDEAAKFLSEMPTTLESLSRNVRLSKEFRRDKAVIEGRFAPLEAMYAALARFDVQADENELQRLSTLRPGWDAFQSTLEAGEELIKRAKTSMKKDTLESVTSFQTEVSELKGLARESLPYGGDYTVAEAKEKLASWRLRIANMREREAGLVPAMEVFEQPVPDYPQIVEVEKDLTELELIWGIAEAWESDWNTWKTGAFSSLDVSAMEEAAGKYRQKLIKNRHLNKWGVWIMMEAKVKELLSTMPLIQALGNPAMRDRHWRSLMKEIGIAFDPTSPDFTLEKVMEYGFPKYGDFIEELSGTANKEVAIEAALTTITATWKNMEIDLVEYKTVYWKIRSTEELFQVLEDQSVTVSTMKASPYYPSFAKDLDYWEKILSTISEIVDLQLNVQRQWMYLESIFMASEDIRKMLPTEAALFDAVNTSYNNITTRITQNRNALVACSVPGYLSELEGMDVKLEQIQKALDQYLENKRQQFPRFYFLSNDDLLEILGQSKDPVQVQKHIKKCFEGIQSLQLLEPGAQGNRTYEAHGMNAPDGEKVPFERKVIVEGAVEAWLIEVEKCMKLALQKQTGLAIPAAKGKDKLKWIKDFPGQLLITTGMIYFVLNCEKQLRSDQPLKNLKVVRKKQVLLLNKLAEIVRSPLDKVSRKKVVALITMELHTRDVMERMIKANCSSVDDFEWLSQLRLEFLKNEGGPYGTVVARQTKSTLEFGFEYQGNNGRLVVTPLTDRCVLTLTTALYMQRGGAPAGPAGTGKTETVKDLGKNLAKFVVVFNCSDGLDYKSVGRMFSGLVQSGGWGCFDEFNRIEVEVLSVVAQQVLAIMEAIKARKTEFLFMDIVIKCNWQCGLFITMNPSYAGRSELPDNLKSLFRPVAMMVPDLALIAEVMLQSEGFQNSRPLAKKTVTLYSLMIQQLSKQDHYDYGLRSLRGVLVCAGSLKRSTDLPEDFIVLRAIRDMNLPKFIKADAELFRLLLGDLFPSLELPPFEPGDLGKQIEQELTKAGLQLNPVIMQKCIELRDSKATRHCNMLVGRTLAGKSTTWKMLAAATTSLANAKVEGFQKVRIEPINPKSISMNELYGAYDLQTMEWTDGILSSVFRMFARDEKPDEKWLLLDGPVDTLWIESMNTVMDDNKTLTLINGDRIGMTEGMSLLFEVQDLSVASPATTSRAGMIYIDVADLGWGPYVTSWIARNFKTAEGGKDSPMDAETHNALFQKYVPRLLRFRKHECKELVPTGDFNSVISLCNLLEATYAVADNRLGKAYATEQGYAQYVERWFAFACVWSIGAAVDENGRRKFNEAVREVEPLFPPTGSVYDYYVDPGSRDYRPWSDKLSNAWRPSREMPFSRIIVPTVDTLRNIYIVHTLVTQNMHVMVVGNTGTGKTVLAQQELDALSPETYGKLTLYFSAATSSNTVQDIIEGVLEKRSKNKMGPIGGKKLVILVDDLNMPKKDTFGSQPPLELLRQWVDYGGWYDRGKQAWRYILDIQLITAMGPPGGGRSVISERLQSRFNIINFTFPNDKTVRSIFELILAPRWSDYAEDVKKLVPNIVAATVAIYEKVVEGFLPTPANCHYLFNLRDIAKVIQGCLSANRRDFESKEAILRLWIHECLRTFADRFTSMDDVAKFRGVLDKVLFANCEETYKKLYEPVCENADAGPVYVDFLGGNPAISGDSTEPIAPYTELGHLDKLRATVEEDMIEYNGTPGLLPMNLVFFRDALRHVARIHRILRTPRGNALLVGVGGSGRQSLARVGAFLTRDMDANRMGVFSIEITKQYRLIEFHDDLKKLYNKTGVEGKPTMFLFSDTQIKEEAFLEDINNILNSGEVPNLYTKDERSAVIDAMRPIAKKLGASQMAEDLWNLFIERVRSNLHVVLAMSPVGAAFRNRTRMYPSLVNCTTIDWFHNWPDDALREVATKFLDDVRLTSGKVEEEAPLKQRVATVFASAHQSVIAASGRMLAQMKRYNYVTPTNYLELVLGYRELVSEKRRELGDARDKLANGLAKLEDSKKQVEEMQIDLAAKQKIVEKATTECEALLVTIVQEKRIADEQKAEVEEQSAKISVEAAKCNAIARDAEADLAEALPALEKAMGEVDKLDNSSISEVKAYTKPPDAVMMVLGGVMTLMNVPTDWASAKKKISESDFLRQIKSFDKDNVKDSTIKKLKKFTEIPGFDPDVIRKSSGAAAALCVWCLAIELYSGVAKEVEPKRNALKAAETLLAEKQAALSKAQAQLAIVIAKVDALNAQHTKSVTEKTQLAMEAAALMDKLARAESLIGGLGGERTRWEASIARYDAGLNAVPGDALVAAAFLSYAGPFDTAYRESLVQGWLARVKENNVHSSDDFNFANFLADPSDVRDWNIQGLPSDQFSTENGVIVTRGRRWPLMVDPQGQANKWIKEAEKKRGLKVTDLKAKDFLRELEQAITYGLPYLLQDVEEELDPALEPVLTKSIIKRGTREVLRLGDKELDYNRGFRLYITTKLPNPHYTPEVSTKAAIVNFAVKEQGLEAQLLGIVVRMEEPRLEQQKGELVQTVATGKRKLADLESTILRLLSEVKGSLLDDIEVVKTLQDSKSTSEEVSRSLKIAEETDVKIDAAREGYRPVATRASLLYFVLNDLASVDPMYQFSLDAYTLLFRASIADSKAYALKNKNVAQIFDEGGESGPDRELKERINNINEWHTYEVYKYACRGLFERHKLLLSFQICIRRQMVEQPGKVDRTIYDFFLKGANVMDRSDQKPNPCAEWLSATSWDAITELDKLDAFSGFAASFEAAGREWNQWYFAATPEREPIPGDWEPKCDDLMRLTVVRTVRPDRALPAAARYVSANLGPKFVEPPPFDLKGIFESSTPITPLVFVLSPGVDPTAQVLVLSNTLGINLEYCSLGQGQAPIATRMINDAIKNGGWVFLQNCHLSISWMPTLEKIIDAYCAAAQQQATAPKGTEVPGAPHPTFRLWLSSSPHPKFPIAILQRGIKLTTEPPRGLKANLVRLYNLLDEDEFNARSEAAPGKYAKLLFSLCWFHAILLERKKFKALGFNIPYDFNDSDFSICNDILADYLSTYKDATPWDAIRYLIAEVNYGGRVTDDWDRRLTNTYVTQYFCEDAVKDSSETGGTGYKLSSLSDYYIPDDGEINDYKSYIGTLPLVDAPQAFGQHPNADIQSAIQDTTDMLNTILSLQPRSVSEGGSRPEDKVMHVAMELERTVPDPFDIEQVMTGVGPRADPEPLKVVLYQECERYNKLLTAMKRSLNALQKGIQGTVVITAELEAIFDALLVGRVPQAWSFCYPSLKPLGLWVRDLFSRVEQLSNWVNKDIPKVFWLSGFTYPTGFLTAVLQTSARRNGLAIDTLEFEFPVMMEPPEKIKESPKEGAYIKGLFLEGAKWNFEEGYLAEPEPMQLFSDMPVLHFKPVEARKGATKGVYRSPMYLYPVRTGTRERPSFMGIVELKSGLVEPDHWVKRGTAILLALAQ